MELTTYEKGKTQSFKEFNLNKESFAWFVKSEELFPLMALWASGEKPQWIFLPNKKEEEAFTNLCAFFGMNGVAVTKKRALPEEKVDIFFCQIKDLDALLEGILQDVEWGDILSIGLTSSEIIEVNEVLNNGGMDKTPYLFCETEKEGYILGDSLRTQKGHIIVPEREKGFSVFVEGVPEEERLLTYDTFTLEEDRGNGIGVELRKIFTRGPLKRSPKDYFDSLLVKARAALGDISGAHIPYSKTKRAYEDFSKRELGFEEQIENLLLESSYEEIPGLVRGAIEEKKDVDFASLVESVLYVSEHGAIDVGILSVEILLTWPEKDGFEEKLYRRLGELYHKKGEYLKSKETYFMVPKFIENGDIYYIKGIESLVAGGEYQEAILSLAPYLYNEKIAIEIRNRLFFLYIYCCNQKKQYEDAFSFLGKLRDKTPEVQLMEGVLKYNRGDEDFGEYTKELIADKGVREYSHYYVMANYLRTLAIDENEDLGEAGKVYNGILEKLGDLKEGVFRKWYLWVYLKKGLLAKASAKLFEGIGFLEEGIDQFSKEEDLKGLTGRVYREEASFYMALDQLAEGLNVIETGLYYLEGSESLYCDEQRALMLLYKTEILERLDKPYAPTFNQLISLVEKREKVDVFNEIKSKGLLLKGSLDIKNGDIQTGIEELNKLYEEYRVSQSPKVRETVLDGLILLRDLYEEKQEREALSETLLKISSMFINREEERGYLERGKALYALGIMAEENQLLEDALSYYTDFIVGYEGIDNAVFSSLKPLISEAFFHRGEGYLQEGRLAEAKSDYIALRENIVETENIEAEKYLGKIAYSLAVIEEELANIKECIGLYEDYLQLFKENEDERERILDVYYRLGQLFEKMDKGQGALKYYESLLEALDKEKESSLYVKGLKGKGDVLLSIDEEKGREAYGELVSLGLQVKDHALLLSLAPVYRYMAGDVSAVEDTKHYIEIMDGIKESLSEEDQKKWHESEGEIIVTFSNGMESEERMEEERWGRNYYINAFGSAGGVQTEKRLAKAYYRLLLIAIQLDNLADIRKAYEAFLEGTKMATDPFSISYVQLGKVAYGIELYKREDFEGAFTVLSEEVAERKTPEAYYYLGLIYEKKGDLKKGIKLYDEGTALSTKDMSSDNKIIYYEMYLKKIECIENRDYFLGNGKKKALKELEEYYLPKIENESDENLIYLKVKGLYKEGSLYISLGKEDRGKDVFRKAIEIYEKSEDSKVRGLIREMYKGLEG